jgi:hypothetical protein
MTKSTNLETSIGNTGGTFMIKIQQPSLRLAMVCFAVLSTITNFKAWADDSGASKSTAKLENFEEKKAPGQDADELITNRKMRTESGSKSRYSISTGFSYNGGSLQKPLDDHRPNISQGTGNTNVATLGGSVSGKYGINSTNAILAGTGMRWITPLAGTGVPSDYHGKKVDVDNPYGIYQHLYNWMGLQAVVQANVTVFTASNLVRDGYVTTFGLSQNSAYQFPGTRFTLGALGYVGLGYFDNNSPEARANQSDYSVGFSPFAEYALTDRLNLRTGSNLAILYHSRNATDAYTFKRQKVTENIGVGYAVRRDVYLSAGIDFVVGDIRSDRTTLSAGAGINIF